MSRFIVIFIAVLTFLRLFLGADYTDESQYVAQAYSYLLDGVLFKSDLFVQGTPGVLLSPFLLIFTKLLGTDGIVLFLRISYFFAAISAACVSYTFLKKFYQESWALIASSFLFAFIPFSLPSWSYNTVAGLALPTSLYVLLMGGSWMGLWAGIIGGFACFAYPPLAVTYSLALWLITRKDSPVGQRLSRQKKLYFFLGLSLIGLFSILIIAQAPAAQLLHVIEFSRSFGELGGLGKLKSLFGVFKSGFVRGGLLLFLIGFWILKKRGNSRQLENYDFWLLSIGLLPITTTRIANHTGMGWLIYAPILFLIFMSFGRLDRLPEEKRPYWFRFLLVLTLLSSAIFGYCSGNILINAAIGMLLPLQILVLEAGTALSSSGRATKKQIEVFAAAIAIGLCISNYHYVYLDAPIYRLTSQIPSGPYKYIFTTANRVTFLAQLEADLKTLRKTHSSLFAAYLAAAYHFSDFKPITNMLFLHDIVWKPAQFELILNRTLKGGEWPDLVLIKNVERPNFDHQFETFFAETGKYKKIIERNEYRIWSLTKP